MKPLRKVVRISGLMMSVEIQVEPFIVTHQSSYCSLIRKDVNSNIASWLHNTWLCFEYIVQVY